MKWCHSLLTLIMWMTNCCMCTVLMCGSKTDLFLFFYHLSHCLSLCVCLSLSLLQVFPITLVLSVSSLLPPQKQCQCSTLCFRPLSWHHSAVNHPPPPPQPLPPPTPPAWSQVFISDADCATNDFGIDSYLEMFGRRGIIYFFLDT